MNRPLILLAAGLLTLGLLGCAGSEEKAQPEPETERQSLDRAARHAFAQAQYAQAATLYQAALAEALAEDDPKAIIDARFNLALSQTYVGQYAAAMAQVAQADAERLRRSLDTDPELELLRATIHYRTGDLEAARAVIEPLLGDAVAAPTTRARAHFVAGLIAADTGDDASLRDLVERLAVPGAVIDTADRVELEGRLAALDGDPDTALGHLERAVLLRGAERDYRGMVRALASAGDVAQRAGRTQLAATYLLRAGRSAAQRRDPEAQSWLERAIELADQNSDKSVLIEAESVLQQLSAPQQ